MYKKHTISVSIPAYQEEKHIVKTLQNIPKYVDFIVPVNDGSTDKTWELIKNYSPKDTRIYAINSKNNCGVGATIKRAHKNGLDLGADIVVVMAGDNQMDPHYLSKLLDKLVDENYDYAKGNRFYHGKNLKKMSKFRLLGNIFITFMTKVSTGYWSIADPLNGYTAIKISTLKDLELKNISPRYDFEISILHELYMVDATIADVFIPAVYEDEVSTIQGFSFTNPNSLILTMLRTLKTLFRGFFKRIFIKYTLLSMHPMAIFYISGFALFAWGLLSGLLISIYSIGERSATTATVMLSAVPFILGIQFLLQAINLDIQNEPQ